MNGKKIGGWMVRGGIAAEGCSPIGAGSLGGEDYCGNLLWQSSETLLPPEHGGMFAHRGGQHGRRRLLWQFTVAIKCDPVAPRP